MWPFRRKSGKHTLGAAVTAIPTSVRIVQPLYDEPAAPEPAYVEPALPVTSTLPEPVAPAYAPPPDQPRVELGFRDGSTAALAPGSEQAKALTDLASILTHRD